MEQIAAPKPKLTPLEFLEVIYLDERLPLSARLKAAVEAAQYVHPKLAVTATVGVGDFADQLERAVEASRKVILDEKKPIGAPIEANVCDSDVPSNTKPT